MNAFSYFADADLIEPVLQAIPALKT